MREAGVDFSDGPRDVVVVGFERSEHGGGFFSSSSSCADADICLVRLGSAPAKGILRCSHRTCTLIRPRAPYLSPSYRTSLLHGRVDNPDRISALSSNLSVGAHPLASLA